MGYVPYVGFATHRHVIVRIHLYLKRLMIKQIICIKKKKKRLSQQFSFVTFFARVGKS
jgi:hypothetical protein